MSGPSTQDTGEPIPERNWLWRWRSALGLLPGESAGANDLRQAVRMEDHDEVMRLLEAGVVPSQHPEVPWLCLAARRQNRTLLDLLIIHGALLDQPDTGTSRGRTALHEAAKRGWIKGLRLLLDCGADLERCDARGMTALAEAAARGHHEAMALLMEAGARLDDARGLPQPLLHQAACPSAVDLLVHAGADVNGPDDLGLAPLHRQAHAGRASVVERLLFHQARPDLRDRQGRTAAFWLGRGDPVACARHLLAAGLDFHAQDVDGQAAPHQWLVRIKDPAVLSRLHGLAPGAWQVPNRRGQTALDLLERTGRAALAQAFARTGQAPG